MKDIIDYLESQENIFGADKTIAEKSSTEYKQSEFKASLAWLKEFFKDNGNKQGENEPGLYYYYNFLPKFREYWVSE
jgi:hypothetical protein